MMHIGHPIVGDSLYSPFYDDNNNSGQRLCLHAESIRFHHPASGSEMTLYACCEAGLIGEDEEPANGNSSVEQKMNLNEG